MTEQIQSLWRRLEYVSRYLKVLWIAQKVFSVYLGGHRRWIPPDINYKSITASYYYSRKKINYLLMYKETQ